MSRYEWWMSFLRENFGDRAAVGAVEFAKKMGWSVPTVSSAIRRGELRAIRLGKATTKTGKYSVLVESLAAWLADREVNAGAGADGVEAESEVATTTAM